ncbi:MAG: leucyl/phenylalanyl-tRNA--protein transferase [Motiliproteus sp.]|jgi:leucyl/phenylalanyl-tRNA--protein transferase
MTQISWLDADNVEFPPLEQALAEPDGLLAAGGDLSPARLIQAYRNGIFPWYDESQPILWWSPDPRCILKPEQLHVSRSLRKLIRQQRLRVSIDQDFSAVILACAGPRSDADGTWISPAMQQAYQRLHQQGVAHSVEVWEQNLLVGGLYGLAIGKTFFGESMFSRVSNASKLAFVTLVERLQQWDYAFIDCQVHSQHLTSLGATEVPRSDFIRLLNDNIDRPQSHPWELGPQQQDE